MRNKPDNLNPDINAGTRHYPIPVRPANDYSLQGYGRLVDNIDDIDIKIVRWPATGTQPVDLDGGNEAGTEDGAFECSWRGYVVYRCNSAVGGDYILGYACDPHQAREQHVNLPTQILLWHAIYHPDGGQLFFPLEPKPFIIPRALADDDVTPEQFIAFHFDGTQGLYIHPNIWHEGVYRISGIRRFRDRQGTVHARVPFDFTAEFGCLLAVPIAETA